MRNNIASYDSLLNFKGAEGNLIVTAIFRCGNIASANEIEIECDSKSVGLVYRYLSFNSPRASASNVDIYPRYNDFGVSSYRPTKQSRNRYYVPRDDISGKPLKPSRDTYISNGIDKRRKIDGVFYLLRNVVD